MKKRMVTAIVAIAILCMMPVTAFANSNVHIFLAKNQAWTPNFSVQRTTNFSYISVSLNSVYPSQGTDKYEKIQARIVDNAGTLIINSSYEVLTEGSGLKKLSIKEGYLSNEIVYLQFRGNTKEPAEAIVDYYGH